MILDRAVRLVRPARTPLPATTRLVLAGSAVAWVTLTVWGIRSGGAHDGPLHGGGVVDPWQANWLLAWLLMVAAMMWPLTAPALVVVSRGAFRAWRAPLAVTCLGTVTVLWVIAGLAIASLAHVLGVPALSRIWQIGWVAVALLAGRSARRARVLWRCTKIPAVAPGGARGVVSASIAGAVTWRRCALLCGPLMAAMVVGHDPVLTLSASFAAWWEAAHPRTWRDPVPTLLLTVAAAWLLLLLVAGPG